MMPNRFDHLDGYQFVILPGQIPIVLLQHRDSITETSLINQTGSMLVLFFEMVVVT